MSGKPDKQLPRAAFWMGAVLIAAAVVALPLLAWSRRQPAPAQPMRFSHKAHFEEATCEACHLYVMELPSAGEPRLADCMDCHDGMQSEEPRNVKEEEKLVEYMDEDKEIPWIRLPPLTSDIYFSHRRHAALGEDKIDCKVCHGNIGKSDSLPAKRAEAFTMNWCLDCHEKRRASLDCLDCHR